MLFASYGVFFEHYRTLLLQLVGSQGRSFLEVAVKYFRSMLVPWAERSAWNKRFAPSTCQELFGPCSNASHVPRKVDQPLVQTVLVPTSLQDKEYTHRSLQWLERTPGYGWPLFDPLVLGSPAGSEVSISQDAGRNGNAALRRSYFGSARGAHLHLVLCQRDVADEIWSIPSCSPEPCVDDGFVGDFWNNRVASAGVFSTFASKAPRNECCNI